LRTSQNNNGKSENEHAQNKGQMNSRGTEAKGSLSQCRTVCDAQSGFLPVATQGIPENDWDAEQ